MIDPVKRHAQKYGIKDNPDYNNKVQEKEWLRDGEEKIYEG